MTLRPLPIALLLLSACQEGGVPVDTAEGDADADMDADTDADGDADVIPWVESATAVCYLDTTGGDYYQWETGCVADDPQGADSLVTFDQALAWVAVLDGGGDEVARYALVCSGGDCTSTFRETDDGVLCAGAAGYTFRFQVADEDDHVSLPYDVQGVQQ
ncbi:MAG: hypothetical protein ABIO70_12260 [Pseudomonadota bacterium]